MLVALQADCHDRQVQDQSFSLIYAPNCRHAVRALEDPMKQGPETENDPAFTPGPSSAAATRTSR